MMNGINVPLVKVEHEDGLSATLQGQVKSEQDSAAGTPSAASDDDIYEDAGDLDFSGVKDAYLLRLPRWLWENWSQIDDDEPIKLGTVRVENLGKDRNGNIKQKMSMLLLPSVKYNKGVPREYNIHTVNDTSTNLYLFTEKDLPSYKAKARQNRVNGMNDGDLKPLLVIRKSRTERDEVGPLPKIERNRRWQPYYRKAVPKHTALAGAIKHEINCLPIENEEYTRLMAEKALQDAKPKKETKFLSGMGSNPSNLLAPGTLGASGDFGGFIRTGASHRAKAQDHKAARIPQNELLDLIYDCFKRYGYWSMKALKAELNQPEAYLKSTLEKVAELVKSGRFAMTWTLKSENKIDQYANLEGVEELAPDAGFGGDGANDLFDENDEGGGMMTGDDEDEDDVKMEDVLPS